MYTTEVRAKLNGLFPARNAITPDVDFAPNGGTYQHGTLYLSAMLNQRASNFMNTDYIF